MGMRNAFTLIELLVVISIISLLSAMLMSVLPLIRAGADGTACRNNLRQIGLGISSYANSWEGYLVSPWNQDSPMELRSWQLRIATEQGAVSYRSYQCPSNRRHRPSAIIPAVPAPMDGGVVTVQWHSDYALPVANWGAWWNNYNAPAAWIDTWSPWDGNGSQLISSMAFDTALTVEAADRPDLANQTQFGGGIDALADSAFRMIGQHRGKDGLLCADGHVELMTALISRGSGGANAHRGVWSITPND
jgi:prepilin-type N-terminal cleavage/methylation domain-containing protein